MSRVRSVALAVVVGAGLWALALIGPIAAAAAVLTGLVGAIAPSIRASLSRVPWPLVTLPVVGVGVPIVWAVGGGAEEALGVTLAYLQVHRRLARQGTDDDRVSVLLAGLMLVAAGSRIESALFLGAVLPWVVAAPLALLPDIPGVRAPGALAALPAGLLFGTIVLFPLLPRLETPPPVVPDAVARTGFAPDVALGALDRLLDDPTEVFRVSVTPEVAEPVYFRGVALDRFDGRRWWSSAGPGPAHAPDPSSDAVTLTFRLRPGPGGRLFTAGRVASVDAGGLPLRRDGQGAFTVDKPHDVVRYTVRALPPLGTGAIVAPPEAELATWLTLPEVDPRVVALATRVAPDVRDPEALAAAFATFLRDGYAYTRAPGDAGTDEPLTAFLLERRAGHCEYFASALAVLLRLRGVPTRIVNGFVGGERDAVTGQLVVRRYHAHAWVEALTPRGWMVVDATPGPLAARRPPRSSLAAQIGSWWEEELLAWDGAAQRAAVLAAGRRMERVLRLGPAPAVPWRGLVALGLATLVVAVGLRAGVVLLGRRLAGEVRPSVRGPIAREHRRARRHLERVGWRVPEALPPVEAARWIARRAPGEGAAALEELAWLFYAVRYGSEPEAPHVARARELADRVMRLAPPHANG